MRAVPLSRETRRTLIRAAVGLAAPVVVAGLLGLVAPASIYLWIKAGHLTAVIGWMGGMIGVLYLFVWQAQAELGSREAESLAEIEQQAMRVIVNPAMVMTWGLGLWLAWRGNWFSDGWLHAKLFLSWSCRACTAGRSGAFGGWPVWRGDIDRASTLGWPPQPACSPRRPSSSRSSSQCDGRTRSPLA